MLQKQLVKQEEKLLQKKELLNRLSNSYKELQESYKIDKNSINKQLLHSVRDSVVKLESEAQRQHSVVESIKLQIGEVEAQKQKVHHKAKQQRKSKENDQYTYEYYYKIYHYYSYVYSSSSDDSQSEDHNMDKQPKKEVFKRIIETQKPVNRKPIGISATWSAETLKLLFQCLMIYGNNIRIYKYLFKDFQQPKIINKSNYIIQHFFSEKQYDLYKLNSDVYLNQPKIVADLNKLKQATFEQWQLNEFMRNNNEQITEIKNKIYNIKEKDNQTPSEKQHQQNVKQQVLQNLYKAQLTEKQQKQPKKQEIISKPVQPKKNVQLAASQPEKTSISKKLKAQKSVSPQQQDQQTNKQNKSNKQTKISKKANIQTATTQLNVSEQKQLLINEKQNQLNLLMETSKKLTKNEISSNLLKYLEITDETNSFYNNNYIYEPKNEKLIFIDYFSEYKQQQMLINRQLNEDIVIYNNTSERLNSYLLNHLQQFKKEQIQNSKFETNELMLDQIQSLNYINKLIMTSQKQNNQKQLSVTHSNSEFVKLMQQIQQILTDQQIYINTDDINNLFQLLETLINNESKLNQQIEIDKLINGYLNNQKFQTSEAQLFKQNLFQYGTQYDKLILIMNYYFKVTNQQQHINKLDNKYFRLLYKNILLNNLLNFAEIHKTDDAVDEQERIKDEIKLQNNEESQEVIQMLSMQNKIIKFIHDETGFNWTSLSKKFNKKYSPGSLSNTYYYIKNDIDLKYLMDIYKKQPEYRIFTDTQLKKVISSDTEYYSFFNGIKYLDVDYPLKYDKNSKPPQNYVEHQQNRQNTNVKLRERNLRESTQNTQVTINQLTKNKNFQMKNKQEKQQIPRNFEEISTDNEIGTIKQARSKRLQFCRIQFFQQYRIFLKQTQFNLDFPITYNKFVIYQHILQKTNNQNIQNQFLPKIKQITIQLNDIINNKFVSNQKIFDLLTINGKCDYLSTIYDTYEQQTHYITMCNKIVEFKLQYDKNNVLIQTSTQQTNQELSQNPHVQNKLITEFIVSYIVGIINTTQDLCNIFTQIKDMIIQYRLKYDTCVKEQDKLILLNQQLMITQSQNVQQHCTYLDYQIQLKINEYKQKVFLTKLNLLRQYFSAFLMRLPHELICNKSLRDDLTNKVLNAISLQQSIAIKETITQRIQIFAKQIEYEYGNIFTISTLEYLNNFQTHSLDECTITEQNKQDVQFSISEFVEEFIIDFDINQIYNLQSQEIRMPVQPIKKDYQTQLITDNIHYEIQQFIPDAKSKSVIVSKTIKLQREQEELKQQYLYQQQKIQKENKYGTAPYASQQIISSGIQQSNISDQTKKQVSKSTDIRIEQRKIIRQPNIVKQQSQQMIVQQHQTKYGHKTSNKQKLDNDQLLVLKEPNNRRKFAEDTDAKRIEDLNKQFSKMSMHKPKKPTDKSDIKYIVNDESRIANDSIVTEIINEKKE